MPHTLAPHAGTGRSSTRRGCAGRTCSARPTPSSRQSAAARRKSRPVPARRNSIAAPSRRHTWRGARLCARARASSTAARLCVRARARASSARRQASRAACSLFSTHSQVRRAEAQLDLAREDARAKVERDARVPLPRPAAVCRFTSSIPLDQHIRLPPAVLCPTSSATSRPAQRVCETADQINLPLACDSNVPAPRTLSGQDADPDGLRPRQDRRRRRAGARARAARGAVARRQVRRPAPCPLATRLATLPCGTHHAVTTIVFPHLPPA